jgi:hypothetical protein
MKNSSKFIRPYIADYLVENQEEFELLKPGSEEENISSEWLKKKFPIASWGRIDWSRVQDSTCIQWSEISEQVPIFDKIIADNGLGGDVVVLWTNASKMALKAKLAMIMKYSQMTFDEDWDTWICNLEGNWCIELYHEGEICFGYGQI